MGWWIGAEALDLEGGWEKPQLHPDHQSEGSWTKDSILPRNVRTVAFCQLMFFPPLPRIKPHKVILVAGEQNVSEVGGLVVCIGCLGL